MKALLQRVRSGSVEIAGETVGRTGRGYVILVGFTHGDSAADIETVVSKISGLRVFEDDAGKMNLSIKEINGGVLIVSQFTLYADCVKGRRPGFSFAAVPDVAEKLYDQFVERMRKEGFASVETGRFGADMQVSIQNDGPVTVMLESLNGKIQADRLQENRLQENRQ